MHKLILAFLISFGVQADPGDYYLQHHHMECVLHEYNSGGNPSGSYRFQLRGMGGNYTLYDTGEVDKSDYIPGMLYANCTHFKNMAQAEDKNAIFNPTYIGKKDPFRLETSTPSGDSFQAIIQSIIKRIEVLEEYIKP